VLSQGDLHDPSPGADSPSPKRRLLTVLALLVVVLLSAAAGAGVAARALQVKATYQSTAVLLIDQEPALSRSRDNGLLVKLVTLRIKYVDLLSTRSFTDALAAQVGVPPGQLVGRVQGAAPPTSLLLRVTATSRDQAQARTFAQAAADKLVKDLATSELALGLQGQAQVTLTVVTPAAGAVKIGPSRKKAVQEGAAAGGAVLVLGLGLIVVARRRR
jgi:capsular polysaccharide biosynthesis protein